MRTSRIAVLAALALGAASAPAAAVPTLEWSDTFDGGIGYIDYVTAATTDLSGNPVFAGESADGEGGVDMLVRCLERESGIDLWVRRWASFDTNDMALSGIVRDGVGNFLVGGFIRGCVG
jgi:opacity protein-like surface antigen